MRLLGNISQSDTTPQSEPVPEIPVSVKQVGSVDSDIRIYMEDYVHTYLYRFAKMNASKEKLAALMGKTLKADGEDILIINGVLQGKFTASEKGVETFTEKSWETFKTEGEKFFRDSEIVGWAHTQPGYGAFLMVRDETYHKENFPKKHQVLYVLDPMEKSDAFFVHEKYDGIRRAKGYFIYYDKNENMQAYMEENPVSAPKENKFDVEDEENTGFKFDRIDAAKRIRDVLKRKEKPAKSGSKYNAALGISAAFLAIVLVIGAGLIKNNDKLVKLEDEMRLIAMGNGNSAVMASAEYEPVVFEEVKSIPEETEEPTTAEAPEEIAEEAPVEEVSEGYELSEDEILCYYNVKKGDSLRYISRKYFGNTSMVNRIAEVNNITSPDMIYYGRRIAIPKE